MSCTEVLHDLVQKYLSLYIYDTAKFFAERLYYENNSPENLNILAQCYYRQGKHKQTYYILQDCTHPSNKYLFALSCIALNKLSEAERALTLVSEGFPSEEQVKSVPEGSAGLYLLGKICRRQQRRELAMFYFKKVIEFDPSCWSAILEYTEMGGDIDFLKLCGLDIEKSISIIGGTMNDSKKGSQKAAQVEKNKMAESLNNAGAGNVQKQHTAMLLGKSSASLHVPFTAAGSPIPNVSMESHNASAPGSAREEVDLMSPGLTPIGSQRPSLLLPGGSAYPLTGLQFTPHSEIGTLSKFPKTKDDGSADFFSLSNAVMMDDRADIGGHGRRVSFGPPSRLSFSEYGRDEEDTGDFDHEDVIPPTKYPRRSLTSHPPVAGALESSTQHRPGSVVSGELPAKSNAATVVTRTRTAASGMSDSLARRGSMSPPSSKVKSTSPPPPSSRIIPEETSPTRTNLKTSKLNASKATPASANFSPSASRKPPAPVSPRRVPVNTNSRGASPPPPAPLTARLETTPKGQTRSKKTQAKSSQGDCENVDPEYSSQTLHSVQIPVLPFTDAKPSGNIPSDSDLLRGKLKAKALVTVFASALQFLMKFQCKEAIDVLNMLPASHFCSGYVYSLIGKAYLEMADYRACLLAMRAMIRLEPYRVQGTETMSTALWQLKNEKELSALGQQVVDIDKFAPETWCVVGNCFSLQREHDTALKFFERAIQIDPYFAYAHTLCGHEHVFNENLDKALVCFRSALKVDNRHYNAWYGLGSIFYRQERLELAEYHFRKATEINPNSTVLQCYLGIVLHAQHKGLKTIEAKQILQNACLIDPKNPQLHFQLAHILLSCAVDLENLLEVEAELLIVRDLAPKEPPVFVMLGQVCQRLGKTIEALQYFNIAMDLDPKQSSSLKLIIDEIGNKDGEHGDIIELVDDI